MMVAGFGNLRADWAMLAKRGVEALEKAADMLERQAKVMEADVPDTVDSEGWPLTPEQTSNIDIINAGWVNLIQEFGEKLDKVITQTYLNDMTRAKAIRKVVTEMLNFEANRF